MTINELVLIVSELAEATEAARNDSPPIFYGGTEVRTDEGWKKKPEGEHRACRRRHSHRRLLRIATSFCPVMA